MPYKKMPYRAQVLLVIAHAIRKRWEWITRYKKVKIVYCHECLNRYHCPIRVQCLGDDGYCSLGKSEEV